MSESAWGWVSAPLTGWRRLARVLLFAVVFFVALNILFALLNPLPALGTVTLYNVLIPGRERLPYGESPAAYNLSLDNLNAMFASHRLSQRKADDEFRVVLIGDSSVWGTLLENDETLAGLLDGQGIALDGKTARFYNVGYPTMSVTKDLLMLERALAHDPDLILWPVTLESMPVDGQLDSPILQRNPDAVRALLDETALTSVTAYAPRFLETDFWGQTMVGSRRALADLIRLQAFGVPWSATGIDQTYPDYTPRANDLEADESWHGRTPETGFSDADLAFDALAAGKALAGEVPILLINEPIFRADGANSDVRYNAWYPRWAYDVYRDLLAAFAAENGLPLLDLWDAIPATEFTDSPVHLTPEGSAQLAARVQAWLTELVLGG